MALNKKHTEASAQPSGQKNRPNLRTVEKSGGIKEPSSPEEKFKSVEMSSAVADRSLVKQSRQTSVQRLRKKYFYPFGTERYSQRPICQ